MQLFIYSNSCYSHRNPPPHLFSPPFHPQFFFQLPFSLCFLSVSSLFPPCFSLPRRVAKRSALFTFWFSPSFPLPPLSPLLLIAELSFLSPPAFLFLARFLPSILLALCFLVVYCLRCFAFLCYTPLRYCVSSLLSSRTLLVAEQFENQTCFCFCYTCVVELSWPRYTVTILFFLPPFKFPSLFALSFFPSFLHLFFRSPYYSLSSSCSSNLAIFTCSCSFVFLACHFNLYLAFLSFLHTSLSYFIWSRLQTFEEEKAFSAFRIATLSVSKSFQNPS